jgi:hypothetical protein
MQFVCDAPGSKAWFRIETEGEAGQESEAMQNAVEVTFADERKVAMRTYRPSLRLNFIERDIGLSTHIQRTMPMFLTLRDREGTALANAMLPPGGKDDGRNRSTVTGPCGDDVRLSQGDAIAALEKHFGFTFHTKRHVEHEYVHDAFPYCAVWSHMQPETMP